MKLDKKERLNLIHQFLILEKLYPEEADYYASNRKALEEGYELHYDWIFQNLWDDLSAEECKKVLNILDMYRAINFSSTKINNERLNGHYWLKFKGFDGNEETEYMAYCRYFIVDLDRFEELRYNQEIPDFNTHFNAMPKYTAMLNRWLSLGKPLELDSQQILDILEAKPNE